MPDHVLRDISNGVLTLTLNRPDKKNALTRGMYAALAEEINRAGGESDVRCVLIQAEGNTFTAGNDLSDFAEALPDAQLVNSSAQLPCAGTQVFPEHQQHCHNGDGQKQTDEPEHGARDHYSEEHRYGRQAELPAKNARS